MGRTQTVCNRSFGAVTMRGLTLWERTPAARTCGNLRTYVRSGKTMGYGPLAAEAKTMLRACQSAVTRRARVTWSSSTWGLSPAAEAFRPCLASVSEQRVRERVWGLLNTDCLRRLGAETCRTGPDTSGLLNSDHLLITSGLCLCRAFCLCRAGRTGEVQGWTDGRALLGTNIR